MAIRVRNKVEDTGVSKKDDSDDLRKESSSKTEMAYDIPDVRSFRDQSIQVLNILDSHGINIYDETRTPGMYLKKKNRNVSSNLIQNILQEDNSHEKTRSTNSKAPASSTNNQDQKVPQGLFDFFNNNK